MSNHDTFILSIYMSMFAPNPIGGAFIVNKLKYIEAGIENRHFYGWEPEDRECYDRWNRLRYKVGETREPLFLPILYWG